eukprot:Gb_36669 [translate_table: standard]
MLAAIEVLPVAPMSGPGACENREENPPALLSPLVRGSKPPVRGTTSSGGSPPTWGSPPKSPPLARAMCPVRDSPRTSSPATRASRPRGTTLLCHLHPRGLQSLRIPSQLRLLPYISPGLFRHPRVTYTIFSTHGLTPMPAKGFSAYASSSPTYSSCKSFSTRHLPSSLNVPLKSSFL